MFRPDSTPLTQLEYIEHLEDRLVRLEAERDQYQSDWLSASKTVVDYELEIDRLREALEWYGDTVYYLNPPSKDWDADLCNTCIDALEADGGKRARDALECFIAAKEKTNEVIADLDAIPGLKKQAWDSWNQLVDTGTIRSAIESPCRHRWVIVNVGGPLVCERCGKAMPEMP